MLLSLSLHSGDLPGSVCAVKKSSFYSSPRTRRSAVTQLHSEHWHSGTSGRYLAGRPVPRYVMSI